MSEQLENRPRLLTARQVADQLGVRTDFVYDLARRRLLPMIRVGRYCRFDPDALGRWIAEGGTIEGELGPIEPMVRRVGPNTWRGR